MNKPSTRVFSMHYIGIDIEAGVTNKNFENFVREKGVFIPNYPGWKWVLLKGLRGERANQYLMLYEIESIEALNRYIDSNGMKTNEANKFLDNNLEAHLIIEEWKKYASFASIPTIYTDYVLLAENTECKFSEESRYVERSGQEPLARVIGIHNLALHSGVTGDDFESFISENHNRIVDYPGWKFHVLKCHRGNRLDQYVMMMEIESLEAVEHFYPQADIPTLEVDKFAEAYKDTKAMYEEWKKLASFSGSPQMYTDYIVVAESQA
ncbi:MAG: hypothetical protein GY750_18920 [Lentisphaerae bacterium]|nr:hypothetical protein [Lentisphaerota bacterium]MCP4103471.1 hypothetical protein [Lentisphaerota bacterium]